MLHADLSCLPAPLPLPPSLCLQGSIRNLRPTQRWRNAPCGGGGFQKSQYWPEFPPIQNPCPGRRWRQAPCGGGGFQKSQYWPKFPSIQKPLPGPALGEAPCYGEGFQKSQYWPKFPSIQNPCRRGVFFGSGLQCFRDLHEDPQDAPSTSQGTTSILDKMRGTLHLDLHHGTFNSC